VASVFKPKGKSRYVINWVDEHGKRRKCAGYTDRAATQQKANELEKRARKIRDGLLDPKEEAYAVHEGRPLCDHLADFGKSLEAADRTPRHVQMTLQRAGRMVDLMGARRISGLSLSKAQAAVAALRDEGLGQESQNHYVRAVKAFSRWLRKDRRAREHLLADLATSSSQADRRHPRRALTPDEATRLILAAESGPVVKGLSGPVRALAYRTALGTGYRADELRSLTVESFCLDSDPPTIACKAAYTKNGEKPNSPVPIRW
jgi:integrase